MAQIGIDLKARTVTREVEVAMDEAARKRGDVTKFIAVYDFSGCSAEEELEFASRTVAIRHQARIRRNPAHLPEAGSTVVVDASAEVERGPIDKVSRAKRAMAALTPEEREALLESLTK